MLPTRFRQRLKTRDTPMRKWGRVTKPRGATTGIARERKSGCLCAFGDLSGAQRNSALADPELTVPS